MNRVPRTVLGVLTVALVLTLDPAAIAAPSAGPPAPSAGPAAEAAPRVSADDPIDRVIAISVDGLNPLAIRTLGPSRAPAFHRLMREGAWTFNARTAYEQTITLPNHTGMLTGRRIERRAGGHGVTFNSYAGTTRTGPSVHQAAGGYVASVFDVVHDRGGRTALFASKTKFALYARSWNAGGAPDRAGVDNGRAKIDRVTLDTDEAALTRALTTELTRSPRTFTFLHLALPDEAGHAAGFGSARYLAAVREIDRLLGQVLKTIAARPALRQHTLVALTADHGGGSGTSHSDATKLDNYRVPFMVWGPGVAAGRNLYGLNPTYRSPGTGRPPYAPRASGGIAAASTRSPLRNADLANLVTDVLDLPAVPGSELNHRRTLTVFAP